MRALSPWRPMRELDPILRRMENLFERFYVLGLSMGALITQHLAADFPACVRRIVLALAGTRGSPEALERGRVWQRLALEERWAELCLETTRATFTGMHQVLGCALLPLLVRWPEGSSDFVVSTQACLEHDARDKLSSIRSPTLVLGGTMDQLFPAGLFREVAEAIPHAQLQLIEGSGHGVHIERKTTFNRTVLEFLASDQEERGLPLTPQPEYPRFFGQSPTP